jgi:uncharacterized protein (DUF2147 family)
VRIRFRKESRDPVASPNIRRTGAQAPRLEASHTVQQAAIAFAVVALAMTPGPAQAQNFLAAPDQVGPSGASCRYEAITVSTGSSVCQTGTTCLCNDGQWVNMGSMCR